MKALTLTTFLIVSTVLTAAPHPAERNGQHDFDFAIGTFKTHIRRLESPLSGSTKWSEADGVVSTRKIWNGRANLEELNAGPFQGATLRLYDPHSRQWSVIWANAKQGVVTQPAYGEYKDGHIDFFDQESFDGKTILVRQTYSAMTADSYHFEQAFSADRGHSWETNFVADLKRLDEKPAAESVSAADRNKDFDFNFGRWKTHVSRLKEPLTGSKTWVDYDGTSDVAPVWDGRASLFELNVTGPAGHIEGAGLRLYNAAAHEWNLNWANGRDNVLGVPTVGGFKDGRGEFTDQETFDGRAILVRNTFTNVTADGARFEQAFSADGGATWETNWIMTFERAK